MAKFHYYRSLDTLKILTFWKIIQENNFCLLDFDYYEGKKYSNKKLQLLEETWLRLYDEYYILSEDSFVIRNLENEMELKLCESDLLILRTCYNTLFNIKNSLTDALKHTQEVYTLIKKKYPKINIQHFESIDYNLNLINKVIGSLTNKYNRLKSESKTEVTKKIKNVYDIVNNAESWVERPIPINDMVVMHWISLFKEVKQRQKKQKNGG